jgi:1-acyl-sn-glycerol-3-phosphate acyltransferase
MPDIAKAVVIVAPHTSNWDFIVGVTAKFALGLDISWLGKHTVFRRPTGGLMRWLGGIPVDRRQAQGVVRQCVEEFQRRSRLLLGLSPEGTRSQVQRWRTGFYHIALGAGVPIVLVSFDYARRVIGLGPVVEPSGRLDEDLERMQAHYQTVVPKRRL